MSQVGLAEEAFIAADPGTVRARVGTPAFARELWPDLQVRVTQDRGREGQRYRVTGRLAGTAEVWLEEWADGVVVHVYLRVGPGHGPSGHKPSGHGGWRAWRADRERRRRRRTVIRTLWRVKDALEAGRRPGVPANR